MNGFTLAVWVKAIALPITSSYPCTMVGLISSFESNKAGGLSLTSWYCGSNFLNIVLAILDPYNGKFLYMGDDFPNLNVWVHYVFTLDYVINGDFNTMFKVYKDGSLVSNPVANHFPPWDKPASAEIRDVLVFGRGFVDHNSDHSNVIIDNLQMFGYSVNQNETSKLFNM